MMGEYTYQVSEVITAADEIRKHIVLSSESLLKHDYPEEDIAFKIMNDLADNELKFDCKNALSGMNLIFNKSERVKEKARRLRLEGVPREEVASTLYKQMEGVSKHLILKVCSELGYTDPRFANRQ